MTITVSNIIPRQLAPVANTALYTSSNGLTIIDKFTATNVGTATATLTVMLPAQGETAGTANTVMIARQIAPGEAYTCPETVGQVLKQGGQIVTAASLANHLVISASGREVF